MTWIQPELVLDADGVRRGVAVRFENGLIAEVASEAPADALRFARTALLPGFVNAHSHAFQRDLRGAVERVDPANPDDDFWTWREEMYAQAGSMDPTRIHDVARRCYRQMRASGATAVGEFHYVHHQPDGTPYERPNALAEAVCEAAEAEGLRIVMLLVAYERGGEGMHPRERHRLGVPAPHAHGATIGPEPDGVRAGRSAARVADDLDPEHDHADGRAHDDDGHGREIDHLLEGEPGHDGADQHDREDRGRDDEREIGRAHV